MLITSDNTFDLKQELNKFLNLYRTKLISGASTRVSKEKFRQSILNLHLNGDDYVDNIPYIEMFIFGKFIDVMKTVSMSGVYSEKSFYLLNCIEDELNKGFEVCAKYIDPYAAWSWEPDEKYEFIHDAPMSYLENYVNGMTAFTVAGDYGREFYRNLFSELVKISSIIGALSSVYIRCRENILNNGASLWDGKYIKDQILTCRKLRFDSANWMNKAFQVSDPALVRRVVSQKRRFAGVAPGREASEDSYLSRLDYLSKNFGARVSDDFFYQLAGPAPFNPTGFAPLGDKAKGLSDVLQAIHADPLRNDCRGGDVLLVIVDTGINGAHPAFAVDRRFDGWAPEGYDPWEDPDGHGTMAACIAAANGGGYIGVAPDAKLMSCRTNFFDSELTVIYDRLTELRRQGHVIVANNSFAYETGDPPPVPDEYDFHDALSEAIDEGVHVVFAAGNNNLLAGGDPEGCDKNSVWLHHGRSDLLSVGTCDLDGNMWPYSSRGPNQFPGRYDMGDKPDVIAPTPANGGILYGTTERVLPQGWGTSGAAPQVAGLAASLLSARPDLSREDLFKHIRESAVDLGHGQTCQGAGMIDCRQAFERLALEVDV